MTHKGIVVTGVIGADAHIIGNKILTYALEEAGFKTVSLGCLVTQEEYINAAIETKADAIFISSLYGMAMFDCDGIRDKCREAGLKNILLYIGGNLVTVQDKWNETEKKFIAIGFDRVYPPGTLPEQAISDLEHDLGRGNASSYEAYKEKAGFINGLGDALLIFQETLRKYAEIEDE